MPVSSGSSQEVKKSGTKRPAASQGGLSKRNDLFLKVKYHNDLPDVPFDPKYLMYPFESSRYEQYVPTSLERNYKHEYLTEADLGVLIDLIVPETYALPEGSASQMHPLDEALLEEEVAEQPRSKRAIQHAKKVSWLRKTEYIASEYNRSHASSDMAETTVGYSVKKKLQDQDAYKDRASQIAAITESFDQAKTPITKHYSKPGVVAEEILPLFPDFDMWRYPFAQVLFDSDPLGADKPDAAVTKEMSQAMIRGMVDENGEQFVAYFLPTKETLQKREEDKKLGIPYRQEEEYDYIMTKDYNWNVKSKASKGYEETYFIAIKPGQVAYYNELETRIRLNKRRSKAKAIMNTKLMVTHRDYTDDEILAQETRTNQLENALVDEDFEENLGADFDNAEEELDVEGGDLGDGGGVSTQDIDFETAFGGDEDEEEGDNQEDEAEGEEESEDDSGDDSDD